MEATMLLCDWAEQINGKLYIQGGGWSLAAANRPISIALAIRLAIPWDRTNLPHKVEVKLIDDDTQEVVKDEVGNPITMDGKVEVGRPAGLVPGTPIDAPLAIRVPQITLPPGAYRWELHVGGDKIGHVSFRALEVN